jgi:hypothetical protein
MRVIVFSEHLKGAGGPRRQRRVAKPHPALDPGVRCLRADPRQLALRQPAALAAHPGVDRSEARLHPLAPPMSQ